MQSAVSVLGIPIAPLTMEESVSVIDGLIKNKKPSLIATANAEMVMMAQQDDVLADILRSAALVVPDGAGVVWAARQLGRPVPERVAGYDLAQKLLTISGRKGYRLYFLGAAPGIAAKAKLYAEQNYPGVAIVGVRDGYFQPADEDAVIAEITEFRPDILLVALGVPRQEKWLANNLDRLQVPVVMGVGGTFDVMAGIVTRAPAWMQQSGLEWLYRLLKQPQRALRMLALPRFVLKVLLTKK